MSIALVLILILPDHKVKRFVGRTMTHHATTNRDLTAMEIEAFRTQPDACMEPEGQGDAA